VVFAGGGAAFGVVEEEVFSRNAEAAKDKTGVWDANSKNKRSSATGLTQFLKSTWKSEATRRDTYLNQRAKELGYIDKNNKIVDEQALLDLRKNSRESIVAAAEMGKRSLTRLIDAGLVDAKSSEQELARAMYLTHQSGYKGAKRILNVDNNPKQPILTPEKVKELLTTQIGSKRADTAIRTERGNAPKAYRNWLQSHMNKFVKPSDFK